MSNSGRKRLRGATILYWMLLFYIIAALVWWFISLEGQSRQMADLQYKTLNEQKASLSANEFAARSSKITADLERNSRKYIAEGVTFLILILIGAFFVYGSVHRQFKMQQQQQNFMMAVTHELKTPISVARLNLETLQKYSLDPEKQKKL
ncbi:MAG TPA: histidine kinase dimerization/phospho-acceptor domain-containing protein, partial [Chitinophagaceae bacterium]